MHRNPKATANYTTKKKSWDKKIKENNAMIDTLPAPDFNEEKDKVQRDSEWENYCYIRDFIYSASQRQELKKIKFGLIIDRTKATNLVAPLARAGIDKKICDKINFVHISGGEMEKHAKNPKFCEIFYYTKRLAAIMASPKAKRFDGNRSEIRSDSDSDTDKE